MTRRSALGWLGRCAVACASTLLMAQSTPGLHPPAFTVIAPYGEYEGWEAGVGHLVAVKSRVRVVALAEHGEWLPVAWGQLVGGAQHVTLKVASLQPGTPLVATVHHYADEKEVALSYFTMRIDRRVPFDMELSWTSDGMVCMSLRQFDKTEHRMLRLGAPPERVGLYGSGGEFRFEPVELLQLSAEHDRATLDQALKAGCVPMS